MKIKKKKHLYNKLDIIKKSFTFSRRRNNDTKCKNKQKQKLLKIHIYIYTYAYYICTRMFITKQH